MLQRVQVWGLCVLVGLIATCVAAQSAPVSPPASTNAGAASGPRDLTVSLTDDIYNDSLRALTILFVVAVLLESAFTTIFEWRVFLTYFSRRGIKTLIMILASYWVVRQFDLDIFVALLKAYQPNRGDDSVFGSQLMTALILAGGSAGVYNLMHALGYRSDRREREVLAQPEKTEAWVAVDVRRVKAVGLIEVHVSPPATASATPPTPIAGTIGRLPRVRDLLVRNKDRFPSNGGHSVQPNTEYVVELTGADLSGNPLSASVGPFVLAPGAIVDFAVTL